MENIFVTTQHWNHDSWSRLLEVYNFFFSFFSLLLCHSHRVYGFKFQMFRYFGVAAAKFALIPLNLFVSFLNLEDFCKNWTCKMFQKIIILRILGWIVHIFPLHYRGVGEVGKILKLSTKISLASMIFFQSIIKKKKNRNNSSRPLIISLPHTGLHFGEREIKCFVFGDFSAFTIVLFVI